MTDGHPSGSVTRLLELESALAQLRHAYHNLIGPEGPWNRAQRMRFADGLIAPQIEKLESLAAVLASAVVPSPQRFQIVNHSGISMAKTPPEDAVSVTMWPAAGGEWVRWQDVNPPLVAPVAAPVQEKE